MGPPILMDTHPCQQDVSIILAYLFHLIKYSARVLVMLRHFLHVNISPSLAHIITFQLIYLGSQIIRPDHASQSLLLSLTFMTKYKTYCYCRHRWVLIRANVLIEVFHKLLCRERSNYWKLIFDELKIQIMGWQHGTGSFCYKIFNPKNTFQFPL